jgi:hypothetical protein
MKEMTNVRIAFDLKERNCQPPVGYKQIPMKMIFDIKMDFTRKARLVAGGHKTEPLCIPNLLIRFFLRQCPNRLSHRCS